MQRSLHLGSQVAGVLEAGRKMPRIERQNKKCSYRFEFDVVAV